jgi:hypothetical protein
VNGRRGDWGNKATVGEMYAPSRIFPVYQERQAFFLSEQICNNSFVVEVLKFSPGAGQLLPQQPSELSKGPRPTLTFSLRVAERSL